MAKKGEYVLSIKDKGNCWIEGTTADGLWFQAKVYDEGSEYGINKGRVSKLCVRGGDKKDIINFDRGWDIKPKNSAEKKMVNAIVAYLEKLPAAE